MAKPEKKPSVTEETIARGGEQPDEWEQSHRVVRNENELREVTTSAYPLEIPDDETEDRMEAGAHAESAWDEAVHERQEWGAAVDLPRERTGPPPSTKKER